MTGAQSQVLIARSSSRSDLLQKKIIFICHRGQIDCRKKNYFSSPFFSTRLVNSRQQCTARRCSTEKQPLVAAATTRSPCPAPRATPSPSTTPPPPTLGTNTLIPLQGLLVNLQIHIARPQPALRGCQPQHLLLHLLVINSLRHPPRR